MVRTLMEIEFALSIQFRIESTIQRPVSTWAGERRPNTMSIRDVVGTLVLDQGQEHAAGPAPDHMTEVIIDLKFK